MSGTLERDLRVLVADEDPRSLEDLAAVLEALGHEVTGVAVRVDEAAAVVAEHDPDVAMVKLHDDTSHALDLIGEISDFASGPVIALLRDEDPAFVAQAADRGIFAYAVPLTAATVQGAIEVATRRHAEVDRLETTVEQLRTALQRRTVIERGKGILMERHGVVDRDAFELLRAEARRRNRRVADLALAVSEGLELSVRAGDAEPRRATGG